MVIGAALLLAAGGAWAAGQDEPRKGGSLRIAMIGEPPTLDLHWASGTIIYEITGHIYETLFTTDVKYETIPHLAEGFEASDGLKRYVIRLRKGVKFHNGKEMTSADVVASLKRWGKFGTGKAVFKRVETVEARDPYTVEIRLKQPSSVLPTALAQMPNGSAIFPKEVVEAAGDGQIKEYIGTGPFKFVEHKPDRHVRLARFDGYAPRNEAPNQISSPFGDQTRLLGPRFSPAARVRRAPERSTTETSKSWLVKATRSPPGDTRGERIGCVFEERARTVPSGYSRVWSRSSSVRATASSRPSGAQSAP